jgi:hypothetical protein
MKKDKDKPRGSIIEPHIFLIGELIMLISFGKSAYVAGTPAEILDALERSPISLTTTGDGLVIATYDAIEEFFKDYENNYMEHSKIFYTNLYTFLKEAVQAIDEGNTKLIPIGDIFFVH